MENRNQVKMKILHNGTEITQNNWIEYLGCIPYWNLNDIKTQVLQQITAKLKFLLKLSLVEDAKQCTNQAWYSLINKTYEKK